MSTSQNILAELWAETLQAQFNAEKRKAEADPVKHRLSTVFEDGANYRFYATKNARGSTVRFCWSVNRNVAGFYLFWRETGTGKGRKRRWKRDQFDSTKSKQDAKRVSLQRYNELKGAKA